MLFQACSSDSTTDPNSESMVPQTYEFYDADENSTVAYSGQVLRNLIITDIKSLVSSDPSLLVGMYENPDAYQTLSITSGTGSFPTVQSTYGDISSSDI